MDTSGGLVFLITFCIEKKKTEVTQDVRKAAAGGRKNRKQKVGLSNSLSVWKNELWEVMLEVVFLSAFICDLEKVMNSEVFNFVGDITSFK